MKKYAIQVLQWVPENKQGSENDAFAVRDFDSVESAKESFEKYAQKLLQINEWNVMAGKNPTEFYLVPAKNTESSLFAKENDFVKIKMPAPKNKIGHGYDWVIINKLIKSTESELQYLLIQMKPHSCPESASGKTAHFYTDQATNTFIIAQKGTKIQMSVHGRNEIPNTENIGLIDRLRNMFVGMGGIFGGSKLQWEAFAEEFIK